MIGSYIVIVILEVNWYIYIVNGDINNSEREISNGWL